MRMLTPLACSRSEWSKNLLELYRNVNSVARSRGCVMSYHCIWICSSISFRIREKDIFHTIQRLMLSKGAKRTIIDHITVIMQYRWDETIVRSGDMYKDDSGILSLVIKMFRHHKHFGTEFAIRISSVKTVPKCLRKLKVSLTNLNYI